MIRFIKRVVKYLTEDIWKKKDSEYDTNLKRFSARQLKVLIYTGKSYLEDQLVVRCAALTFYTVMSLVPIAAIIFGIAKGFMFETRIEDYLYDKFPQYKSLISQITVFANAMLERTKGGLIASIGFVTLLWAVVRVFNNIERTFNHIWEVHKQRSFARKISDYMAVVLLAPIFWLMSTLITERLELTILSYIDGTLFAPLFNFLEIILPIFIMWLMLTLVYYVMPNTRVKPLAAFRGAVISGTMLYIFQWAYFAFQSSLSSYNAIYGSFAAIPLFLIWLHASWQIVMFGAELSFGYQNIEKYEFEREVPSISYAYKSKIMLLVMHRIAWNFHCGDDEMNSDELAAKLNLPIRIVRDVLYELEEAHLIVGAEDEKSKSTRYYPSRDVTGMKVFEVLKIVENTGLKQFSMEESGTMKSVNRIYAGFDALLDDSDQNILLLDLVTEEDHEKKGNAHRKR